MVDHGKDLLILKPLEINRPRAAGGYAQAAPLAEGLVDLGDAPVVEGGCREGTDGHADAAGGALGGGNPGHLAAGLDLFLGKKGDRPTYRRLGLSDGLLERFRIVSQPAQVDTVGGEINRSQLGVSLGEESIGIDRDLEQLGKGLDSPGLYRRCQGDEIRAQGNGPLEDMVHDLDLEPAGAVHLDQGSSLRGVANEDNPQGSRLPIELLPHSVGADVPVKNEDIHLRSRLLEGDRLLYGEGAADLAAIGPFRLTGTHTLNEDDTVGFVQPPRCEGILQLVPDEYPGMLPAQVLIGVGGMGACCQNCHSMLQREGLGASGLLEPDVRLVVAHKARDLLHLGIQADLDVVVALNPRHEVLQVSLHVLATPRLPKVSGMAAQLRISLHEGHRITLVGKPQRRHHPGHATADNEGGLVDVHGGFQQGLEEACLGHRHAHEVFCLACGGARVALVVGGGIAGMTAALGLAEQGYPVHLVEKTAELGGEGRHIRWTWRGEDVQAYLNSLIAGVKANRNITVHLGSKLAEVKGFVGNFQSRLSSEAGEITVSHGVAVLAVGAHPLTPEEYLYGKHPRVLRWHGVDDLIAAKDPLITAGRCAVFIQCVGSREPERPYCSKICCTHSVTSAVRLKELNPGMDVYILYRDIRTYGAREDLYREARAKGVIFIRYELGEKPRVETDGNGSLRVTVKDRVLGRPLTLRPDFINLATAIVPSGLDELANLFKVPLNSDRFFLEAHAKLRPVDFATDGVFLCGLAHYPKPIEESVAQALAAASRAATVLSQNYVEASGLVAIIDAERCVGCQGCLDVCPFGAISYFEDRHICQVNKALCKGCGGCAATCPSGSVQLMGFRPQQIYAQIDQALAD